MEASSAEVTVTPSSLPALVGLADTGDVDGDDELVGRVIML